MYKNIERLQIAKGPKHFNFVPKTFMIPNEYSEFAATHHRMRGGRSSFKSVSSSIHPIHPSTHYRMRGGTRFLKSSKLFFFQSIHKCLLPTSLVYNSQVVWPLHWSIDVFFPPDCKSLRRKAVLQQIGELQ